MCIVAVDAPCGSSEVCLSDGKQPTSLCLSGKEPSIKHSNPADERKEKSRDAARERRAKEFEYFQELEEVLPSAEMLVDTQKGAVDKTSLIRLTVAYLKSREVVERGLTLVKEEEEIEIPDLDILTCLDGFSLVLGAEGDIIYVSKNVSSYMGLKPVELLGQTMADYIHPCDLPDLASLTSPLSEGELHRAEVTVRMKCTVTERGRMINLNQASYKPLRITGQTRGLANVESGLSGALFLGTASPVSPMLAMPNQLGVFTSRHSLDMKFLEVDTWLTDVLGYPAWSLLGESLFTLVHTADIQNVQAAFLKMKEQGLCSTQPYRLLARGGGFSWVQTRASCAPARRGSGRGQSISCQHFQITGVQEREVIMASIQMPSEAEKERAEEVVELEKTNHLLIFDQPTPKLPTSLPTSVIVTSRPPGPKPVTQSLFRKEREKTVERPVSSSVGPKITTQSLFVKERRNVAEPVSSEPPKPPKVATAMIFGAGKVEEKKRPTVTTSKFFVPSQANSDQVKAQPESTSKKDSENPPASCDASKEYLEEERKFFEMLFNFDTSNLEQLAPHNGVDCVDLKMPSKTSDNQFDHCEQNTRGDNIKSEEYNDLLGSVIDLNEIENFCGLMSDWSPSEPPPASTACSEETFTENWSSGTRFDLTETPLLRPEEDIMWGMESSQSKREEDSVQKMNWGDVTKNDGKGGGTSRKEPPCDQKRKTFCSEVSGEPPKKVRVVQNTSDYLLLISQ